MKIKYNSWEQVPIRLYKEIAAVSAEDIPETDKNVALIALLCDASENEVWNLSLPEIGSLTQSLHWVKEFDFKKDIKFRKVKIGDFDCVVTDNMADFTVAQYVDFNNLWSAKERDISMLLTTFLVPKGKKYNEGYDILELKEAIEDNISIAMGNSLCFFFLKSLATSIKVTLIYLDYIAKRMEKRMTPEGKQEMMKLRKRIESFSGFPL